MVCVVLTLGCPLLMLLPESGSVASPFYVSNPESQIFKEFTKKKTPITQLNIADNHNIMISLTGTLWI